MAKEWVQIMKCSNCGVALPLNSAFCPNCGINLKGRITSPKNSTWIIAMIVVFLAAGACIAGFIWIDRLTADHPEATPAMTAGMNTTDEAGVVNASENSTVIFDMNIIGLWSTEGPSGELVDPVTGYANGSIYNGEWYLFRTDGTYRYVIISSGTIVSGGVVCEGKFSVNNGEILLTDVRESWYPNPAATGQKEPYENKRIDDLVIQYRYEADTNTLIVNDSDYFTKVEK